MENSAKDMIMNALDDIMDYASRRLYEVKKSLREKPREHIVTAPIPKDILASLDTFPDGRMDVKNASKYVGLSEKTMATMRVKGVGPKFIKKGRIFYFKKDLDNWIKSESPHQSTAQARFHTERAKNSVGESVLRGAKEALKYAKADAKRKKLKMPNATTRKAMADLNSGKGKKFKSVKALMDDL